MKDEVRWFLDGLMPQARDTVAGLRAVVKQAVPQAEESVVWGSLSYHRPKVGGRLKGAVCLIAVWYLVVSMTVRVRQAHRERT